MSRSNEPLRNTDSAPSRHWRIWILWSFFAVVVAIVTYDPAPQPGNVTHIYQSAAQRWLRGESLYDGSGNGFIYPPQAAVCFLPLAWLPSAWCGVVWRVVNIGCFALGVRRLAGLADNGGGRYFAATSLIAIPLCWSAARYGQMTLCMGGLMMLAAGWIAERRWWPAAAAIVLAVALKPLALPLMMLAGVLFPRTSWRMLACIALAAAAPFATQHHQYVTQQFTEASQMFRDASRGGLETPYAQLFWSLRVAGLEVSSRTQTVMQIVCAGLTFLVSLWCVWRHQRQRAILYLLTLTCCYILLMNPRTENNTYALMAAPLACFAAAALTARNHAGAGLLCGLAVFMLLGHSLGKLEGLRADIWLKPLVCGTFAAYVLTDLILTRPQRGQTNTLGAEDPSTEQHEPREQPRLAA